MATPHDPQLERRLIRLEEGIAFADRAAEEAVVQIGDLYRRIDAMNRKIESLEHRLNEREDDEAGPPGPSLSDDDLRQNKPPHSA